MESNNNNNQYQSSQLPNSSSSLTPQITSLSINTQQTPFPPLSLSSQTIPTSNQENTNVNWNENNNQNNNNANLTITSSTTTTTTTTENNTNITNSIVDDEGKKKNLRKLQNRQSAAQYRERKKDYLEKLETIVKELDREKLELMQNFNRLTKETNEANFKQCVLEAKLEMEIQENQELRQQLGMPSLPDFPPIENTVSIPANYFIPNFIPPNFSASTFKATQNLNNNNNNNNHSNIETNKQSSNTPPIQQ